MELINWSLNAIDKIFSQKSGGVGEPSCPDGTFTAGYTLDSWNKWKVVCLAVLSVEDVEDVYLFGFLIAGILIIGWGIYLGYRKMCKLAAALIEFHKLLVRIINLAVDAENDRKELHQKVTMIVELLTQSKAETLKRLEYISVQIGEVCRRSVENERQCGDIKCVCVRILDGER